MLPLLHKLNSDNIKCLSKKQIRKLIAKAQDGDSEAQNRIVKCNCKLIIKYAKRYKLNPEMLTFKDLFQEGTIGLINAVQTFDPLKRTAFSTWAIIHIKQRINRYITTNQKLIHVPSYITDSMRQIWKKQYKNLKLTAKEERIVSLYDNASVISLDAPICQEECDTFHDMVTTPIQDSLNLVKYDLETLIRKVKATPRDKDIIRQRASGKILSVIGKQFGITRERTRQIEEKIIYKLKRLVKKEKNASNRG